MAHMSDGWAVADFSKTKFSHYYLLSKYFFWNRNSGRKNKQGKQPQELLLYIKKYSLRFHNIHRKTSVLESLKTPIQAFSCENLEILRTATFKNICERLLLKQQNVTYEIHWTHFEPMSLFNIPLKTPLVSEMS